MFLQRVALSPDETLQLTWGKDYADFSVYLNGKHIASIPDKAALKVGKKIGLPGNRIVMIIFSNLGLQVWYQNKEMIRGIAAGKTDHFLIAHTTLIGWGVLTLLYGVALTLLSKQFGTFSVVALLGPISLGLGIWARMSRQTLPLKIAIGVLVVKFLFLSLLGIIMNIIAGIALYMGIRHGPLPDPQPEVIDENSPLDMWA